MPILSCSCRLLRKSGCGIGLTNIFPRSYSENDLSATEVGRRQITRDAGEQPVGFLGRAHPLVRRALDWVRHLSFGAGARLGQDPRVSAVAAAVPQPTLLYTFLGRVTSQAGREFERVLAVHVTAEGEACFYSEASAWLSLADPARAIRTTNVWEQYFASWFTSAAARAYAAATTGFSPLAEAFSEGRRKVLDAEGHELQQWLAQRVRDIVGDEVQPVLQGDLFNREPARHADALPTPRAWASLTDPVECLTAFATDATQAPTRRSEADSVLRIYRQRQADLATRLALNAPEIVPLGVLMLVPEERYDA